MGIWVGMGFGDKKLCVTAMCVLLAGAGGYLYVMLGI